MEERERDYYGELGSERIVAGGAGAEADAGEGSWVFRFGSKYAGRYSFTPNRSADPFP